MNNITKKAYVKPDIALVDFSLSSSIAANCKYSPTSSEETCKTFESDDLIFFASDTFACDIKLGDVDLCYDVPTDDSRVFSS